MSSNNLLLRALELRALANAGHLPGDDFISPERRVKLLEAADYFETLAWIKEKTEQDKSSQ